MADSTRLTGEIGVEKGERTPAPRLARKMLEGVPERAGRRGVEEVRSLARGMPTEFTTADGEKVTLFMEGKKMTPQEEREWDARADALELDLTREIIRMLPRMPTDARNEAIAALCDAPALPFMPMEMKTQDHRLFYGDSNIIVNHAGLPDGFRVEKA